RRFKRKRKRLAANVTNSFVSTNKDGGVTPSGFLPQSYRRAAVFVQLLIIPPLPSTVFLRYRLLFQLLVAANNFSIRSNSFLCPPPETLVKQIGRQSPPTTAVLIDVCKEPLLLFCLAVMILADSGYQGIKDYHAASEIPD
ncbi:MAG: hypothetical protein LBT89_03865, partial [Planctomycetaceae bacterium]|nr:hypothetical protein [Planctomycetaceae bacterium]